MTNEGGPSNRSDSWRDVHSNESEENVTGERTVTQRKRDNQNNAVHKSEHSEQSEIERVIVNERKRAWRAALTTQKKEKSRRKTNIAARERKANMNEEELEVARVRMAERKRERRANLGEEKTKLAKLKAAETARERKANMSEEELKVARDRMAETARERKANMNEEELKVARVRMAERKRERRANLDEEKTKLAKLKAAETARERKANMNEEELELARLIAAESACKIRDVMSEQERDIVRLNMSEYNRNRRAEHECIFDVNDQVTNDRSLTSTQRVLEGSTGRVVMKGAMYKCAIGGTPNATSPPIHFLGPLNIQCSVDHCRAVHFSAESLRLKHSCCHSGKVFLNQQPEYPVELKNLLLGSSANAKNFRDFIRQYNNASAFASFGANIVNVPGRGPFCLKISGEIYHLTSTKQKADDDQVASYAQLYVYDADEAVQLRMNHPANKNCYREIMSVIDRVIRCVSPYASSFRSLRVAVESEERRVRESGGPERVVVLLFSRSPYDDCRTYNAPISTNDVGMVYVADHEGNLPGDVDIAVYPNGSDTVKRVNLLSPHLDSMVFPLLFPSGESGWTTGLRHHSEYATRVRNTVTSLQFYAHKIAVRRAVFNPVHYSGKLFQQYIVNAYVRCESGRLNYLRFHQKELRVECYQGLLDHLNNRNANFDSSIRAGNVVILPSSFIGGPRYMSKMYQDSMAVVRKFGRPDLFITFTCNPNWKEIQNELEEWQNASDRPDLVARVFQIKVDEFINDMINREIFGKVIAYVYVIEEQKRGLPHLHGLFTFCESDKFHSSSEIDSVVSAELPDRDIDRDFYELVLKHNIHGPCGILNPASVCMVEGKCSKRFPKAFRDETDPDVSGYPEYRRRNNTLDNHTVRKFKVDNSFVVPYSPYLTKKFNAHINVEVCSSVIAVKYIHKYLAKGNDCARIEIRQNIQDVSNTDAIVHDEIKQFLDCRFISAPEAAWRLFENPIHDQSHAIFLLGVHLPGCEQVYFQQGYEEEALRLTRHTHLTAWFNLNAVDRSARSHVYQEIPNFFIFKNKTWEKRKRGGHKVIGRLASVSPRNRELYHLRLLLLKVSGAASYEHLRTVNGVTLPTFCDAARELGLTDDINEWFKCLEEGAGFMMPKALRSLFVIILIHCNPSDPLHLWNSFKSAMSEDFLNSSRSSDLAINLALLEIEVALSIEGSSCTEQGLLEPDRTFDSDTGRVDIVSDESLGVEMQLSLNTQQREVFDSIFVALSAVSDSDVIRCFFVDGPGGSGKTFLYRTLIYSARSRGVNVLSVAWTGIAAILLPGGRTCHTAFNLPLNLNSSTACRVSKSNKIAIKNADLIIWDEAPMAPLVAFEMIENAIKDVMGNGLPFGGKVIVLGGDFRQVLPVCRRAPRGKIIASSIKKSKLWKLFKTVSLNINMRVANADCEFSKWLLELGSGILPIPRGCVESSILLPPNTICQDIVKEIYGESHSMTDAITFGGRAILCPKNIDSQKINEKVLDILEGSLRTFYSVDCAKNDDGNSDPEVQVNFPVEFLNSFDPPGLPPHALNLKIGAIVMLLRNMSIANGLCNGTRMIVRNFNDNVLQVEVITGDRKGTVHFLPRVTLDTSSDVTVPFNLCRRQFPVKLAYGMTVNKSQGQTFDRVGLLLPQPVFTHGQLYVACSRVRSESSLKIQVIEGLRQGKKECGVTTQNIVFREIL